MKQFWRIYWPYIVLVLAVCLAYSNVYGNQFLLDDEFLILKNRFLQSSKYLRPLLLSCSTAGSGGADTFYRPLQGLVYFVLYQLNGPSVFGFHLLNVLLHAANACLVFVLGRKLGFSKLATLAAALLWALHPVHVEAITYISATADPLYAFFCLLGLCFLLPSFSTWRMIAGCLCFVLALASKETAIIFPLLAMLCIMLTYKERLTHVSFYRTIPLWLIAGVYLWLRMTWLHFNDFQFYKEPNITQKACGLGF